MHRFFLVLTICTIVSLGLSGQPFNTDAAKQGLKGNVHWVKRTWYYPLSADKSDLPKPDKSKVPAIYMRPNQLIEYSEQGKMRSCMDYRSGSDDAGGATMHYYYEEGRLKKEVQENDAYQAMYTTTYTYDDNGHEVKRETTRGPGDKIGITENESVESTWEDNNLTKELRKNAAGIVRTEITYTYDADHHKIKMDYKPAGLYSARTYAYDPRGNIVEEKYLDKEGNPSVVYNYEYNANGQQISRTATEYYRGQKQSTESTQTSYDVNGGYTKQLSQKDGKQVGDYEFRNAYDDKGNCIRRLHIKNGKKELIEELEIRYY